MATGGIDKVCKVTRSGGDLGIRIPKEGVRQLKLKEGGCVRVRVEGQTITITRARARKKWTEKELLRGVTPGVCAPDVIPDRAGKELI